jgi:hypothetical protein
MTTDRDFDRIAAAWLDLMPDKAPDRVVAEILEDVALTPQARRPLVRLPWTSPQTHRLLLIAATVMLGVALLGGAVLLAGGQPSTPNPTPAAPPSVVPSPTAADTSIPSPTAAVSGSPVAESLRSIWTAFAPANATLGTGGGPVNLIVSTTGETVASGNFGAAGSYSSRITPDATDTIRIVLERSAGKCAAGAEGTYRWALSADRSQLTLTELSDTCRNRAIEFSRTWVRSLVGTTSVGAGVVDAFDPIFSIVMPDDMYQPRVLQDYVEVAGTRTSIAVWKNPQGFASACSQAERYPYTPGADAFAAYLAQNDAFTIIESTPMTIDGHHAVHVVIEGKKGYAPCPGQDLMTWTPRDLDGHWILSPGDRDGVYLIDVGNDTVMIAIYPTVTTASDKPIVATTRIPASLPEQ